MGVMSAPGVFQVGALATPPIPITKSSPRSTTGVRPPVAASRARHAEATNMIPCATRMSRRRSNGSPSVPAGTARSNTGMLPASGIAESNRAELVSEVVTHCAATVCIQEPTLLVNWPVDSRRKSGCRSGDQPPPPPPEEY
jgi:hypothetical protein